MMRKQSSVKARKPGYYRMIDYRKPAPLIEDEFDNHENTPEFVNVEVKPDRQPQPRGPDDMLNF